MNIFEEAEHMLLEELEKPEPQEVVLEFMEWLSQNRERLEKTRQEYKAAILKPNI